MIIDQIKNRIFEIRGQEVILDVDLAKLYQTETGMLKRAVRRNIERFPDDFMFQLSKEEANGLVFSGVFQIGTPLYNFSAYLPYAFTEQGVAMLSSVLRSEIAIKVNISVMRAFVAVRKIIQNNNALSLEIEGLKNKINRIEIDTKHLFDKIEEIGEDSLKAVNDLSEDIRSEVDDIYFVLNELSTKSKDLKNRNPIGFIKHDKEN